MVLERHDLIGSETSARNSEVIHAGIYYPQGSLKATALRPGQEAALRGSAAENGIGHERIGKLIVATNEAAASGAGHHAQAGCRKRCDRSRVRVSNDRATPSGKSNRRSNAAGALWSPSTGILDSHGFMLALQGGLEDHGGQVVLNTKVDRLEPLLAGGFGAHVSTGDGEAYAITCRELILSAGHMAPGADDGLAGAKPPKAYLAKGNYFKLQGRAPFSKLIYPVPEPGGSWRSSSRWIFSTRRASARMWSGWKTSTTRSRSHSRRQILRRDPQLLARPAGQFPGAGLLRLPPQDCPDRANRLRISASTDLRRTAKPVSWRSTALNRRASRPHSRLLIMWQVLSGPIRRAVNLLIPIRYLTGLGFQDFIYVQTANWLRLVGRDIAGELQGEIPAAADPQERGEIAKIVARRNAIVVKPGDQLHNVHAVALSQLLQNFPKEIFKANGCHHSIDPE
jgi:hypothetical protein